MNLEQRIAWQMYVLFVANQKMAMENEQLRAQLQAAAAPTLPATPHDKEEQPMSLAWVTATDGNGNNFEALTSDPNAVQGTEAPCFVFFDDRPNGFKENGQVVFKNLKALGGGVFGA